MGQSLNGTQNNFNEDLAGVKTLESPLREDMPQIGSCYHAKIAFDQAKLFESRILNRVNYLEKENSKYQKKIDIV